MNDNDFSMIKQCIEHIDVPTDAANRICNLKTRKRYHKMQYIHRSISIAACVALVIISIFCFPYVNPKEQGFAVSVYAAEQGTDDWVKLSPNEKIHLNQTPSLISSGYIFQLDLPEHYQYRQSGVSMGNDCITFVEGTNIYWHTSASNNQEAKYKLPDYMTSSIQIEILDDKGEWIQTLTLEMTKDGEDNYVELTYEDV